MGGKESGCPDGSSLNGDDSPQSAGRSGEEHALHALLRVSRQMANDDRSRLSAWSTVVVSYRFARLCTVIKKLKLFACE